MENVTVVVIYYSPEWSDLETLSCTSSREMVEDVPDRTFGLYLEIT